MKEKFKRLANTVAALMQNPRVTVKEVLHYVTTHAVPPAATATFWSASDNPLLGAMMTVSAGFRLLCDAADLTVGTSEETKTRLAPARRAIEQSAMFFAVLLMYLQTLSQSGSDKETKLLHVALPLFLTHTIINLMSYNFFLLSQRTQAWVDAISNGLGAIGGVMFALIQILTIQDPKSTPAQIEAAKMVLGTAFGFMVALGYGLVRNLLALRAATGNLSTLEAPLMHNSAASTEGVVRNNSTTTLFEDSGVINRRRSSVTGMDVDSSLQACTPSA